MSIVQDTLPDSQNDLEEQAIRAEQAWLFEHIFPRALIPIREGLKECSDLLQNPHMTLPLSSRENEQLKGILTRSGTSLTKGDLLIKLNSIRMRLTLARGQTIHLQQVEDVNSLVHYSLESLAHELYPDTASRIIADVVNNLTQASNALAKQPSTNTFPMRCVDTDAFRPEVPDSLALDLYIQDASLVAEIRTLQPRAAENLLTALRRTSHHATGGFVRYKGADVKVVEHVRVESQDPALIAVSTKLSALKHAVQQIQKKIMATSI